MLMTSSSALLPSKEECEWDSIHLLKLLAAKGHNVSKETFQFVRTQVKYVGHLISDQGLLLDPERFQSILNFPQPQTKRQLRGFLGLVGYHRNWIPNFSLVVRPLYALLKSDKSNPIEWEKNVHAPPAN